MAHWAEVNEENIVVRVLVTSNDDENGDEGYSWLTETFGGTWIKTSYNTKGNVHTKGGTPLHKNYAGIGFTWDGVGFAAPQIFPSWTLNEETYLWDPPIPFPFDGNAYGWNEETQTWDLIQVETE